MHITLFGAAFDPPHLGHQTIAVSLLEQKLTDAVWLLPVKEHHFGKKLAAEVHRLAMVELLAQAVQGELAEKGIPQAAEAVRVETFELKQSEMSITYQTMKALSQLYPQHRFSFVIGSDNLARFHEWHQYQQLVQEFLFFVYPRVGFPLEPLYPGMVVMEHVQPVAVSSTEVRLRVQENKSFSSLVPEGIEEYLLKHGLYRT